MDTAWERVRGSDRPLAQDESGVPPAATTEREPLYRDVADAVARDADGVILAAAGVHHELGGARAARRAGARHRPGRARHRLDRDGDPRRRGADGARRPARLDPRAASRRGGEAAARRGAALVGAAARPGGNGGGARRRLARPTPPASPRRSTCAACRGSPVPTTLVGQVDAGDRRQDRDRHPAGQEPRRRLPLAGARRDRRGAARDAAGARAAPGRGRADQDASCSPGATLDVRAAAAYKAALCLRDPHDHGPRQWLNLGHTFAHALEAAADFDLPHGEAVALGLLAALRLCGRDPAPVDRRARPAAGRGRPRPRLAGAAARQEAERRGDQPRAARRRRPVRRGAVA